jgi:hypothetical protein
MASFARPGSVTISTKPKTATEVANPVDEMVFPSNLVEATTFFAGAIPKEVKVAIELFHSTPIENINELLQIVVKYLEQDAHHFTLDTSIYDKFSKPEIVNTLLTALYLILRTSLRNKAKVSIIRKDLLAMKLPSPVVALLCTQMVKSRTSLERIMVSDKRIHFPKLEKVRWRIDVAISSGSLPRVMRPSILMQVSISPSSHVLITHCAAGYATIDSNERGQSDHF